MPGFSKYNQWVEEKSLEVCNGMASKRVSASPERLPRCQIRGQETTSLVVVKKAGGCCSSKGIGFSFLYPMEGGLLLRHFWCPKSIPTAVTLVLVSFLPKLRFVFFFKYIFPIGCLFILFCLFFSTENVEKAVTEQEELSRAVRAHHSSLIQEMKNSPRYGA